MIDVFKNIKYMKKIQYKTKLNLKTLKKEFDSKINKIKNRKNNSNLNQNQMNSKSKINVNFKSLQKKIHSKIDLNLACIWLSFFILFGRLYKGVKGSQIALFTGFYSFFLSDFCYNLCIKNKGEK